MKYASSDKQRAPHVDNRYRSTLKVTLCHQAFNPFKRQCSDTTVTHPIMNRGKLVLIPTGLSLSIPLLT